MSLTVQKDGAGEPCPDCGATATHHVPANPAHHRCLCCGNSWEIDAIADGRTVLPPECQDTTPAEASRRIGEMEAEIGRLTAERDAWSDTALQAANGCKEGVETIIGLLAEIDRLRADNDRLAALAAGHGAEAPRRPRMPAAIVNTHLFHWEAFESLVDAQRWVGIEGCKVHGVVLPVRRVETYTWHPAERGGDAGRCGGGHRS